MLTSGVISFLILFGIAHTLEVQVQNGKFSQQMDFTLNSNIRYIIMFQRPRSRNPFRIEAWSTNANSIDPILVEVKSQRDSLVWSVPLTLENSKLVPISYQNTSRIFCDRNLKVLNFTVAISTYSLVDVNISLVVTEEEFFYVKNDENYTLSVSPSRPQYFFYSFPCDESGTIILEIDSNDIRCLTASIQKNHCPVFDLDKDISYAEGIHQTIQRSGWMTISKRAFPDGFFLIFAAKVDDYLCNTHRGSFSVQITEIEPNSDTTVEFFISKGESDVDYKYAALVVVVIILCFAVFAVTIVYIFFSLKNNNYQPLTESTADSIVINDSSGNREENASLIDQIRDEEAGNVSVSNEQDNIGRRNNKTLTNPERQIYARTLADLAKNLETNLKSHRYFKYTLNMAVFYIIPVVQLMVIFQKVINNTGNADLCYFNFRCSNPGFLFFAFLSNFNHVYSNIGYILMGLLFLGVVHHRKRFLPKRQTGVPANYDIFYAMGVALIAEGVLSACYHICPTQSHFQFDISFMYVITILYMIKLYQNRHPDITPSTSSTFIILALIIFLAMMGLITNIDFIKILCGFTIVVGYFILCTYLSIRIYYFGAVSNVLEAMRPPKSARFKVVLSVYIVNILLLITVTVLYFKHKLLNLGTLVLTILMFNALLYTIIYTSMKKIYSERIIPQAIIFAVLSVGCWVLSAYFFFQNLIQKDVSPAQSRSWNQKCVFLNFYDKHDLLHLFSAGGIFSTFMYLLCLDDDIIHKKRVKIIAF